MFTISMNVALTRAESVTRHAAWPLPKPAPWLRLVMWLVARPLAWQLRRAAQKLSAEVLFIADASASLLRREEALQPVDPTGEMVSRLQNLKVASRGLLAQLNRLQRASKETPLRDPILDSACNDLSGVSRELYDAVMQLHWDILEHDASIAARRSGFVASTPDDVAAMLDHIAAGA